MARRSNKKPITIARVEAALDTLAWIISKSSNPQLAIPLWQRLENELSGLREQETILAVAKARLERARP